MSKIFFFVCFIFCFHSDSPEFTWNENHKLIWTDFEGEPDVNSTAAAVTASGITFSYSIQKNSVVGITGFQTQVFAHFYPEDSWCKKEVVNDHILKHEQFHFNITELQARYLRENIEKLKVSPSIAKQLDLLNQQANIALGEMQNLYDDESNNSINKEAQARWVDFIDNELIRLDQYKSK